MQVVIPEIAHNIQTAEILALLVEVGQLVMAEQPVLELEVGCASFELRCPATGKIEQILVGVGDDVKVGDVVLRIRTAPDQPQPQPQPTADPLDDLSGTRPRTPHVRAGPIARRRAKELRIDLQTLELPSRDPSRVTVDQVEARANITTRPPHESGPMLASVDAPNAPLISPRHSRVPRPSAPRAVHEIIDITGLDAARRRYRDRHEQGPRPSAIVFVLKACAVALREHPRMNSSVLPHGRALAIKRHVHIAVSLDTAHGRASPVIHDADQRPLADLAAELDRCAIFGRSVRLEPHAPDAPSRLTADRLEPATFSISNLRSFGGVRAVPRVQAPQVATLGLCHAHTHANRTLLPISLGYDPRVNDDAAARSFVMTLAELIADPIALLMRV